MLVRLLLALADRVFAEQLAQIVGDPSTGDGAVTDQTIVEILDPGVSVSVADRTPDPDLVVVDSGRLGALPGSAEFAAALHDILRTHGDPELVYLAGAGESPTRRAAAMTAGCHTVLDGGAPPEQVAAALRTVLARHRQTPIHRDGAATAGPVLHLGDFLSRSPGMEQMIRVARRVAGTSSSILVLGETGVGKERLARAIHDASPRRDHPFVVVNCGAIPETLIESELFGHEKGSFTGAHRRHHGHFEIANGGTIMLDEIGDLPLQLQVKLLRVLQERVIQRVGGEDLIPVDVRVISATNRDLREAIATRQFRSDLFYRIGVVALTIPPLRERREDIPLMVQTYLDRFRSEFAAKAGRVSPQAMSTLLDYDWPGNVREVVNVIERAVLLADEEEIATGDLPEEVRSGTARLAVAGPTGPAGSAGPSPARNGNSPVGFDPDMLRLPLRQAKQMSLESFEHAYLDAVLRECGGRINETAAHAGIDPRSLYDKMRRLGLRKEDYKRQPDLARRRPSGQAD